MILLFGGTTEGKQAIEVLKALQCPFVYSTKTKVSIPDSIDYRYGALDVDSMYELIKQRQISLIINCSHPFASELHKTIASVASTANIKVIRLERQYPDRLDHALVQYVADYSEALEVLSGYEGKTLLALSGVQSIPKLKDFWKTTPTYFRILDRAESKAIANDSNFPAAQLILGLSDGSLEAEIATIEQKGIEVILTKESGESGGLSNKIQAALDCKVPIIILKKPAIPTSFELLYSHDELKGAVVHHLSSLKVSTT